MTRASRIAAVVFVGTLTLCSATSAMARGGSHSFSPQRATGPTVGSGGGKSVVAAKSVNLGGLSRFVLKNVIKGGKVVAGSLGTVGGAMAGPGKCPGGVCGGSL